MPNDQDNHVPIEPYRSMTRMQLVDLIVEAGKAGDERKKAMLQEHYFDRFTVREQWIEENGLRIGKAVIEAAAKTLRRTPTEEQACEVVNLAHKFMEEAFKVLMPADWGTSPLRPGNMDNPLAIDAD